MFTMSLQLGDFQERQLRLKEKSMWNHQKGARQRRSSHRGLVLSKRQSINWVRFQIQILQDTMTIWVQLQQASKTNLIIIQLRMSRAASQKQWRSKTETISTVKLTNRKSQNTMSIHLHWVALHPMKLNSLQKESLSRVIQSHYLEILNEVIRSKSKLEK